MTIVRCDIVYMDWSKLTIPNCYDYITRGKDDDSTTRCYLFDSGYKFKYGIKKSHEMTASSLRQIDIYWKIDSIFNHSFSTVAIPSINIELRNRGFSRWDPPDYIPVIGIYGLQPGRLTAFSVHLFNHDEMTNLYH